MKRDEEVFEKARLVEGVNEEGKAIQIELEEILKEYNQNSSLYIDLTNEHAHKFNCKLRK